jgi:hypothetical protein
MHPRKELPSDVSQDIYSQKNIYFLASYLNVQPIPSSLTILDIDVSPLSATILNKCRCTGYMKERCIHYKFSKYTYDLEDIISVRRTLLVKLWWKLC